MQRRSEQRAASPASPSHPARHVQHHLAAASSRPSSDTSLLTPSAPPARLAPHPPAGSVNTCRLVNTPSGFMSRSFRAAGHGLCGDKHSYARCCTWPVTSVHGSNKLIKGRAGGSITCTETLIMHLRLQVARYH